MNDLLTIGGSSLDGLTTNVITLSNCNFFSISEIQIDGDEASAVPEPGSVMLLITGLVGLGIVRRRRLS